MVNCTDHFLHSGEKEDKCKATISAKGNELNVDDGQNTQRASNISEG